jgi:hypothetical protein
MCVVDLSWFFDNLINDLPPTGVALQHVHQSVKSRPSAGPKNTIEFSPDSTLKRSFDRSVTVRSNGALTFAFNKVSMGGGVHPENLLKSKLLSVLASLVPPLRGLSSFCQPTRPSGLG